MSQAIAGEILTIELPTGAMQVKVEDASKSETILAKIIESNSPDHQVGRIYTFDRKLLSS